MVKVSKSLYPKNFKTSTLIATKSMTVKNGGNTIDAVEGLALWVSHCISRACALAGWVQ